MTEPITPQEVDSRESFLPPEVLDVFNCLIIKHYRGKSATVLQKEVLAEIRKRLKFTDEEIFGRHLLDVESTYRKAGWRVEYHQPDYTESGYEPYFVFTKP